MSTCVLTLYGCAAAVLILDAWVVAAGKRSPNICIATVRCFRITEGITPAEYVITYTTFEFVTVFVSDCIVVWRAWVLWRRSWTVIVLCGLLLSGTLAMFTTSMVIYFRDVSTIFLKPNADAIFPVPVVIAIGMSLATNLWTTLLVAIRTWQYRRAVCPFAGTHRGSQLQKIMVLLVESGAVYFLLWLVYFVALFRAAGALYRINYFLNAAVPYVAGMYPTVIFVLVGMHRSFRDQVFTDAVLDGAGPRDDSNDTGSGSYDIVELTIPTIDADSIIDGAGSATASVADGKSTPGSGEV